MNRKQFIKKKAKELSKEWFNSSDPVVSYLEKAIQLGIDNSNLKENKYQIIENSSSISILENSRYLLDISHEPCFILTKEKAMEIVNKIVEMLENE